MSGSPTKHWAVSMPPAQWRGERLTEFSKLLADGDLRVTKKALDGIEVAPALGSVRKVMSQIPHGTSQRNHRRITFRELVEARNDSAAFLQPSKHALDDVVLSVLGAIKQSWQARLRLALHAAPRDFRLQSTHCSRSLTTANGRVLPVAKPICTRTWSKPGSRAI
ncbi:hypothetical protein D3C75_504870 [compost metagenome]